MRSDVAIVGAGIGGAVLALDLGRRGWRVALVERESAPPRIARPEILWGATLRALAPDGVAEAVRSASVQLEGIEIGGEAPWLRITREDLATAGVEAFSTNPSMTRAIIADAALATGNVEIHRGFGAPDGQRVAFFSTLSGKWAYWTIRTDGSDLRRLTPDGEGTIFGVWSPDGLRFVWNGGRRELWLLDAALDGSARASPRRLEPPTAAPENFLPQAWSPQGDRIAGAIATEGLVGDYFALAVWSLETGRSGGCFRRRFLESRRRHAPRRARGDGFVHLAAGSSSRGRRLTMPNQVNSSRDAFVPKSHSSRLRSSIDGILHASGSAIPKRGWA
jgi:hypothetical protein